MLRYLIQASYNNQEMSGLLSNSHGRAEAVRPVIECMGGSLESFGDYDVVAIVEFPDNVNAAAIANRIGLG